MTDIKTSKDALVSALFELSKAAQDAASATVNFYKVAHESSNDESLTALASAINSVAPALELANAETSNGAKQEDEKPKGKKGAKDGAAPEKKKKKVEKDPNAPKKPLTIYFAFSFHTRETIREERKKNDEPPLSAVEMNELVKERWNSISAEEKSQWQKKYQTELKEYQKAKEAYQAKLEAEKAAGILPASQEKTEPAPEASVPAVAASSPVSADSDAAKKAKEPKKRKSESKKHEEGSKKKKEKGEKKKDKSEKEKEK